MSQRKLKVSHLNVRSLQAHLNEVRESVHTDGVDILALTETWLFRRTPSADIAIDGYKLYRRDFDRRGAGLAFYVRKCPCLKVRLLPDVCVDEQYCLQISVNSTNIIVCVVYRNHSLSRSVFLNNLESLVANCMANSDKIIILGDMNINLLDHEDHFTFRYIESLSEIGMNQLISEPTRGTSLLDHIFVSEDVSVNSSGVLNSSISDHDTTFCVLNIKKPKVTPFFIQARQFKYFNQEQFDFDLQSSNLDSILYMGSIDDKVEFLNDKIISLFEKHAPLQRVRITKPYAPWITDNIRLLMSLRDKSKQKYKKSGSASDWESYKQLRNFTTLSLHREKKAYLEHKLRNNDSKLIFKELKILNICQKSKTEIPSELSDVNEINNYFVNSLPTTEDNVTDDLILYYNNNKHRNFCNEFSFCLVDLENVAKLISDIKTTSVGSDGVSISFVKLCCPYILPFITNIINSCLLESYYPNQWKEALVVPIPKKETITQYNELRPISVLPVLSKVLERIMGLQLRHYLEICKILPACQSGFRSAHSCTTALLKVSDDILQATDRGQLTILVLLDFSRAFDTVRHDVLISILRYIGLGQGALLLLQSYLSGRTQRVKYRSSISNAVRVIHGVPQGSVLGPLLFTIYTHDLLKYVKHCSYHMYADDTQIYHSFDPNDLNSALEKINLDLNSVYITAAKYSLRLNPSKSSVIVFGSRVGCGRVRDGISININTELVQLSDSVKNLGVVMDNSFRYISHVGNCLKRAYGILKMLYPHRRYLPEGVKLRLCESLILSQFNYCSQLYSICLDQATIYKIQKLQNSCLRFTYGIRKFQHISHKLSDAGWLNMRNRFKVQFLSLCHAVITQQLPEYLHEKVRYRTDVHHLGIRRSTFIYPPKHSLAIFERSFTYNIYKMWNALPEILTTSSSRVFKKRLTHMCMESQRS